jgi:hypothetical protein
MKITTLLTADLVNVIGGCHKGGGCASCGSQQQVVNNITYAPPPAPPAPGAPAPAAAPLPPPPPRRSTAVDVSVTQ